MSGLLAEKELHVIDEEMLEKAVEEQGPQVQAGRIAKEEGLKFNTVTQVCLNYRNILKIEHLWEFTSLTKLQLDNNKIEKIEGLEKLINLEWLDLSFNNIWMIGGLDSLVKLKDLILCNNRISVIENLDALQNLQIFSLVNNLISELDNVTYLRKFKNLRSLDIAGNPCCRDENYKAFVAAYLPDLIYLDYRLLDEQTREKAETQYQFEIEKLKDKELQEQKAMEVQENMEKELQLHKDAFVEYLNGPHLFDSMLADDEAYKVAHLPGVAKLLESYRTELEALCMQIFEAGLTQHRQRQEEVQCFFTCVQEAIADNQQIGAHTVADFEKFRRQLMAELQQVADHTMLMVRVRDEIRQIRDTFLTLELQLVTQLENITRYFESNITEMVGGFTQYVQGIFVQCRHLEKQHREKVLDLALAAREKVVRNELVEDLPDDVHLLFLDKDAMMNAVDASHDAHLMKMDNREDEILTRINAWKNELMKSIQDDQVKRNRKRLSEIHKYVDYARDQLEATQG